MSHFTVMVIGDNPEEQLAPYHEFECSGRDDKYVLEIDVTEEAKNEYNKATKEMIKCPNGELLSRYEDQFYRELTPAEEKKHGKMLGSGFNGDFIFSSRDWKDGKGYRAKVAYVPEGHKAVTVPTSEVESFEDFTEGYYGTKRVLFGDKPDFEKEHKYGYIQLDKKGKAVKVVDRTNPDKKWDWYSLGGRWTGFFTMKPQAVGTVGKPGLMTPRAESGKAGQAYKRDIDFEAMRQHAYDEAKVTYDRITSAVGEALKTFKPWSYYLEKYPNEFDKARKLYNAQEAVKLTPKDDYWVRLEEFQCSKEEHCKKKAAQAISTFAVIKDGKWYERGSMGWWGAVSDEKDMDKWVEEFNNMLDSIPDDTLLSIYDCHI